MQSEKGVAYCGLACNLCEEDKTCKGCKSGSCQDKLWCKPYYCCSMKHLSGCWECHDFPCDANIFDSPRIVAFVHFIAQYGEEKLLRCLKENEKKSVKYHYPDQLIGDYDQVSGEEAIFSLLMHGKEINNSSL